MSFEDIKSVVAQDGTIGAKLCRLGEVEFFDFRLLEKNGAVLVPTKNGLCLKKEFIGDFIAAMEQLETSKGAIVGPCEMWNEDNNTVITKGVKRACLTKDQAQFVVTALKELK